MSQPPEFAEERRARILELVNTRGRVKVSELAEQLQVTQPTIRKDIAARGMTPSHRLLAHGPAQMPGALRAILGLPEAAATIAQAVEADIAAREPGVARSTQEVGEAIGARVAQGVSVG